MASYTHKLLVTGEKDVIEPYKKTTISHGKYF